MCECVCVYKNFTKNIFINPMEISLANYMEHSVRQLVTVSGLFSSAVFEAHCPIAECSYFVPTPLFPSICARHSSRCH